ncbi:STAS domain-containing protein [Magnetococcus sp. PR-3]|uniref:STAS domain-containing protein n=1 Tax=Magnetococcus sp. PR-3 TaxID=3120355 RepID=UPI002FCE4E32
MSFTDSGSMQVTQTPQETLIVVRDRFNAKDLFKLGDLKLPGTPNHKVIVDIGAVKFMDSSSMGMLLRLKEQLGAADRAIHLRRPSQGVREMLNTVKFDRLFTIG